MTPVGRNVLRIKGVGSHLYNSRFIYKELPGRCTSVFVTNHSLTVVALICQRAVLLYVSVIPNGSA